MKKILFLILFCISTLSLTAQELYNLKGKITTANKEALESATIYISELDKVLDIDVQGNYSIKLPAGKYSIIAEYLGYETFKNSVNLKSDTTLNIELKNLGDEYLQEIVINTDQSKKINIRKPEMSVNTLTAEQIKKMPVVLGETDILKSILLLPGVVNSGEGSSGFNVRGGGSDQNLIQLDDATVYSSSHLYGFFSVFNADVIHDLKLYKGGIPARFGGRASSVLEVSHKNGNPQEFKANGGIGTLLSRFMVEGPIIKDKLSYMVGGRASYAHLFLKLTDIKSTAYFYDVNAKFNYTLDENNNFFLTTYYGRDIFKFNDAFDNAFGNTLFNLRWNHVYNSKLHSNTSLVYSDYYYGLKLGFVGLNWDSGIQNYSFKQDFKQNISDRTDLKYGLSLLYYNFNPGKISPDGTDSSINASAIPHKFAFEPAIYLEAEQELSKKFTVNYGLRYSMFYRLGEETINNYANNQAVYFDEATQTYTEGTPISETHYGRGDVISKFGNLEPRLAISYAINDDQSVKASYNRMTQYVHLISNTASATPLDVWAPSGPYIKPQIVDQIAVGYFQNLKENEYSFEAETYIKFGKNRLDYIDGANLIANKNIEQVLLNGQMRSYGLELLFRKNLGRLTGFVAYTLSKSEQQTKGRNASEPGINYGEWYRSPYDRTHDLSIVASYELNKKWSINASFALQSGRPVTYPDGKYEYLDQVIPSYDYRNNYSLPLYHHLDVSFSYLPNPDKKKGWQAEWVFGIYNIYNRQNAASISFRDKEDFQNQTEAVKLSIFGFVPSVTYNFKF